MLTEEERKRRKKEYNRKWRENNREHKKEYSRKWRENNIERKREYDKNWREANPDWWRNSKRAAYTSQKSSAKARGIEFLFSFEEWWAMWGLHWDKRGCGIDDMQMCRTGDKGPYSPENCRIDTVLNNRAECYTKGES